MSEREGVRMPRGRTWADIAVVLVLAALGVLGFEPSFGGYGFLLAGLGGLVVGALTGVVASMLRLGVLTTTACAIVVYFVVGTPIAVPSQALFGVLPSLQSLASLAIGAVFGWADIVTLTTPIGAPAYIAVVPYVAAWLVALVGTTLAARWLSSRPRTAWRLGVTLLGPVLLYLAGILLGTDEPYQAGIRGTAFAVLALVWLGWRRAPGSAGQAGAARLRSRKLAGTAVILVSAIVLGGAAAFFTAPPKDDRFVLRDEIEPPFDPLDYPSPLAGFRHYTKQVTDEVQFTVQGLRPGDRVRLAALDAFTGKLWNVTGHEQSATGSGSFALVGRELPAPSLITPVERERVTFTIVGYDDVWMPGVGYPVRVELGDADAADDLRYNAATGTMVLTSGLSEGDTYTLDAVVQDVLSTAELREVPVAAVELSSVFGTPDIVTVRAQEFAGSATAPIAQLEAIRVALATQGFLSHGRASDSVPSRAGHGADRISELFDRPQMVGDEEQYASAFALMARSLGYPARVVMGFAPEIAEGQQTVEVTGDDVTAWVEVAFDRVGWVAFDPTPEETDVPQDQVPQPQSEPQPQVRQPPRLDDDEEDLLSPVELEETDDEDNGLPFNLPGWVIGVGVSVLSLAALVVIPMLVIALLKAQRLKRRRTTGPGHDRVAGAWEELVDRCAELGYDVPARQTRIHQARGLEAQLGERAPQLSALAVRADEAVFSGVEIGDARSDEVWTEAIAASRLAGDAVGRGRRLLARYRVNLHGRRTRRGKRT